MGCQMQNTFIVAAVALLTLSPAVHAERTTFYYNATLVFDPDRVVGINGETASEFFSEVADYSGDSGEIPISGNFVWQTTTAQSGSNGRAAAYAGAIVAADLIWSGSTVSADLNNIAANMATSEIGYGFSGSGWCVGYTACLDFRYPYIPTGNLVSTADNTNFRLYDLITGAVINSYSNRDLVYFGAGATSSNGEFVPGLTTTSFGDVNVGSISTTFVSNAAAAVVSNLAIPKSDSFFDFEMLDVARVGVVFDSNMLIDGKLSVLGDLTGSGIATSFCNGLPVTVDLSKGDVPTNGHDVILGTSGSDTINALGGDDTVCGLGGDDTINTASGNDWIDAGAGNDYVTGGSDNDTIYGDNGNDTLLGATGNDEIFGEAGSDSIDGGHGDDRIDGGANGDTLHGGKGNDEINGGDRSDRLYGDDGDDILNGDDYADLIYGGRGNDTINGGEGNDRLFGQGGGDTMYGGDGDDKLYGGQNDDMLYGDAGDDRIWGETGHDKLYGGNGNDSWLGGGDHNDVIFGGGGDDIVRGGDGRDRVYGQGGKDDVRAQAGDDLVTDGGPGTDSCQVAPGNDPSPLNCE